MKWLAARLFALLIKHVARPRVADFVIGSRDNPYLERWYLFGKSPEKSAREGRPRSRSFLTIKPYLHCFIRSDDDRAHHDHPNPSISLCLAGTCTEHTIEAGGIHRRRQITAGTVRFRTRRFAHRIEVTPGQYCWTLFVFFGSERPWGFHCPEKGWVHFKDFTDPRDTGAIGRGCE